MFGGRGGKKKEKKRKQGPRLKRNPRLITKACYIPASSPPLMTATARVRCKQKKKHTQRTNFNVQPAKYRFQLCELSQIASQETKNCWRPFLLFFSVLISLWLNILIIGQHSLIPTLLPLSAVINMWVSLPAVPVWIHQC